MTTAQAGARRAPDNIDPSVLEQLLTRLPCALYTMNSRGGVRATGGAIERLTGHPADDFNRRPGLWWEVIHSDDRERVRELTALSMRASDGPAPPLVFRLVHRNGWTVPVRDVAVIARPARAASRTGALLDISAEEEVVRQQVAGDAEARLLAEQAGVVVLRLGLEDARLREVSAASEVNYGWRAGELIGRSILQFVHPEDHGRVDEMLSAAAAGAMTAGRVRIRHHDGRYLWTLAHDRPVVAPEGTTEVVIALQVIDDHVKVEGRLLVSELMRSELLEQVPVIVYTRRALAHGQAAWEYVSPEFERMTGHSAADFIADSELRLSMVHPGDRELLLRSSREAARVALGVPTQLEHRLIAKDGSVINVLHRWVGVADSSGQIVRWLGSVVDRSEQAEAIRALKRSEGLFRTMLNATDNAVVLRAADGTMLARNEHSERLIPLDSARSGQLAPGWKIVDDDGLEINSRRGPAAVVLETGRPHSGETELRGPGGEHRFLHFHAEPVKDAGDEPTDPAVVITVTDVTDRKVAEREHVELVEQSTRRVAAEALAQELQDALLPAQLPSVAGVGLAVRYVPAGGSLGGDFYAAVPLTGGRLALVIGDVTGHGPAAASLASTLSAGARAYLLEGHGPAAVLDHLNVLVGPASAQMATVLTMVIQPETGTVRFASGGHPPPLLRTAEGECIRLSGGMSVMLGTPFSGRDRPEALTVVDGGSTIVLYTDGLIEEGHRSLGEGLTLLTEAVESSSGDLEALCDRALTLTGTSTPSDDVALLACFIEPVFHDRLELDLPADPDQAAPLREALERWLARLNPTPDETFQLLLVANEAVVNAIQHAYGIADASLRFYAEVVDRTVTLRVADHGTWRTPRKGARQRGLMLMEKLTDEMRISASEEGTEVTLIRTLGGLDG